MTLNASVRFSRRHRLLRLNPQNPSNDLVNFYTQNAQSSVDEPQLDPHVGFLDGDRQTYQQTGDVRMQSDNTARQQDSLGPPLYNSGQSVDDTVGTSGQAIVAPRTSQSAATLSYEYLR